MNKRQIATTIAHVEQYCIKRGVRLTLIRRQILELVLAYPNIVKAYEVLEDLKKLRGNAAPPTVYRALDFFVDIGVLHRAESLNGFVFCNHFDQRHPELHPLRQNRRTGGARAGGYPPRLLPRTRL